MSESPPRTPPAAQAARADILNLTQQLTPSALPRPLRSLRAQLQVKANQADDQFAERERELAEFNISAHAHGRPRKLRKRHNRAVDASDSVPNPATLEERCRHAGRHCALELVLFPRDEVWKVDVDPNFDPAQEYDDKQTFIQDQLHNVLSVLPPGRSSPAGFGFIVHRELGMRSRMAHRIRVESLSIVVGKKAARHFDSPEDRFENFATLIGYIPASDSGEAFYSPLKAEILYDVYDGTFNVDHIFRNKVLLKICASILRGPSGAKGLFGGKRGSLSQGSTNEKIYAVKRTSPGLITNCAVLTIWLYSADPQFIEEGAETQINYRKRWERYFREIHDALAQDAQWVRNLFQYWDSVLFPNAEESHGQSLAGGQRGEEEEFEQARAAFKNAPRVHRPSPSP
ncbi:hypothetical protein MVEN_00019900 [Mycena venus]|uniref:Uncharacterized protein n=1 Tax=Mycena venus TaxID=2733690 RepID=A0A8H6Z6A3_9AGAR|nr:hypothetical protein MVEN_00019900 [Mycena venus]